MHSFGDLVGAVSRFAILAPIVMLIVLAVAHRRYSGRAPGERLRLYTLDELIALAALGIAVVALLPVDPYQTGIASGMQIRPFVSIIDVVGSSVDASVAVRIVGFNVLLFLPLGLVLGLRTRRWTATVGVAFALSIVVETLQALLPLGRTVNVDDVILNTIGAAFGATVAVAVLHFRPSRTPAGVGAADGAATGR